MKKQNLPTLIAIAALSWMLVNISHETFGHAGFGLLSGFKLKAVNTTTAYLDVNCLINCLFILIVAFMIL